MKLAESRPEAGGGAVAVRGARARVRISSRNGSVSAGRLKVRGTKSNRPAAGATACTRFMFFASSFLRQISSMPQKWLIFCGRGGPAARARLKTRTRVVGVARGIAPACAAGA